MVHVQQEVGLLVYFTSIICATFRMNLLPNLKASFIAQ